MKSLMNISLIVGLLLTLLGSSKISAQNMDAQSKAILAKMVEVTGNHEKLRAKKDVQFDYIYDNFDAGKDISKEKIIFDGEQSWASYSQHDRNVMPGVDGVVEQSLINDVPKITLNEKFVTDEKAIGGTVFIREVNIYWFTMLYKLQDNGTNYNYLGTETVDGVEYDKLSLTYDGAVTKKEADDEYILYFNKKTHLIDLFYFSLPAFGINKPVIRMTLEYEVIGGIYVPVLRRSYAPTPEGEYQLNGEYTFKNVKFNNGFTPESFVIKGM